MHPVRVPLRAISRPVPGEQILNWIKEFLNLDTFFSKPYRMSPRVSTTEIYNHSAFWLDQKPVKKPWRKQLVLHRM